jgi:hypothetical protein
MPPEGEKDGAATILEFKASASMSTSSIAILFSVAAKTILVEDVAPII